MSQQVSVPSSRKHYIKSVVDLPQQMLTVAQWSGALEECFGSVLWTIAQSTSAEEKLSSTVSVRQPLSSNEEQDEARKQVDHVNAECHRPVLRCLQIHLSHPLSCCGELELWPHQGHDHCLLRIRVHK